MISMAKVKEKEQGFEESLSSLERIVSQLESGELPLEKALELFERGVGLARRCQTQLAEAERKVELLLRERGEIKAIPFEPSKESQAVDADRSLSLSAANAEAGDAKKTSSLNEGEEDDLDDSFPF
jgi:exodeoxyribonuclease VII small subunit